MSVSSSLDGFNLGVKIILEYGQHHPRAGGLEWIKRRKGAEPQHPSLCFLTSDAMWAADLCSRNHAFSITMNSILNLGQNIPFLLSSGGLVGCLRQQYKKDLNIVTIGRMSKTSRNWTPESSMGLGSIDSHWHPLHSVCEQSMLRVGTGCPLSMTLCMVLCTSAFWHITMFFLLSSLPIVTPMMVISRCYLKRCFEACQSVTRNTGRSHAPFISSNRYFVVCQDLLVDPEASQNQGHPGHMYKYIYANSSFSSPFSTRCETEGFFLQEQCSLGRHKRMYTNTKPLMSMGILNVYSSISWAQSTFFSVSYNKLAWGDSRLGPLLPPCVHLLIVICFKLELRLYKHFLDSSFPSSRSPDFTNLSLDSSMLWMYWKAICIRLDQETYNVLLTFSPYLQTFCFKIVFPVSKHMIVSFAQIQRWLNFPNLSFSDWWPSMSMRQSLIHPHTTPQSWLITEEWMACFWSGHMISK